MGAKQRLMRKALNSLDLLKEIFKTGINKFSFHRALSAETKATFTFSTVSSDKRRWEETKPKKQHMKKARSNTCARPEPLPWKNKCFIEKFHLLVNSFSEKNYLQPTNVLCIVLHSQLLQFNNMKTISSSEY